MYLFYEKKNEKCLFCFKNCSVLPLKKSVLVTAKNFANFLRALIQFKQGKFKNNFNLVF